LKQAPQRKTFMSIFVQSAIRSLPVSKSLLIQADVLKDSRKDLVSTKSKSFRIVQSLALMGLAIANNKGGAPSAAQSFFKGCYK